MCWASRLIRSVSRGENARLKKLLAEAELDKSMLKELAEGNF